MSPKRSIQRHLSPVQATTSDVPLEHNEKAMKKSDYRKAPPKGSDYDGGQPNLNQAPAPLTPAPFLKAKPPGLYCVYKDAVLHKKRIQQGIIAFVRQVR